MSLFASLRGKDGRSLARALVVLILVSLFAGGLSAGAAAAEGRAVICSVAVQDDGGAGSDGHLLSDCCLAGVMPLGMALAAAVPEAAVPMAFAPVVPPPAMPAVAPGMSPLAPLARGPPLHA